MGGLHLARQDPISLWDVSAAEPDHTQDFDGHQTVELAVVGGGYTGLSTALHAAEAGIDCLVLEAAQIGFGGSGRNVGLVNAGMWLPPDKVRRKLGERRGNGLLRLLGDAPDTVFSLIERHQIRCEPVRNGTIHAAHSPAGFHELERRAEQWRDLGAPVELLSKAEAAERIGSGAFHGGLLDHRAGTINPMGYARGLARAARSAGARIYTDVRVEELDRKDGRWMLRTERGPVTANHVVLATNAYTDGLWPGLKRTFTMIRFLQLASEPLGERATRILPGGQGLWDTGAIMFSLRRDARGRIAIGSMGSLIGGRTGLSRRWAGRMLHRLFPDLGAVRFEHAWHGRIALTHDHLPRIHRLAEGLYTPIGYNGRGITTATVFGRAMVDLVRGEPEERLPLPLSAPAPAPNRQIMGAVYRIASTANQIVRGI